MRKLLTPKWLALHALAIVLVVAFLGLAYWQFKRGEAGNARSLGYALQWPAFALFVIYMWIRMARDELRPQQEHRVEQRQPTVSAPVLATGSTHSDRARQPADDEDDDPELDAELEEYNRWLAELNDRAARTTR